MQQFIKAIEIWVPDNSGLVLELSSSYYGDLEDFKSTSQAMRFQYDQGLPGKTWASGKPIVMTDFDNDYFQRASEAKLAGIVCGISVPIFCGEFLHAVVVLFCGGGRDVIGAMEVWHNANGSNSELKLADGYYGELERFGWVSRRLTMMRGRGLPGSAWMQDKPVIIDDLGRSNTFLRSRNAAEVGITTGLAIPFSYMESDVQILTFLSAKGTPIARCFEIWTPDSNENVLRFDSGYCQIDTDLEQKYASSAIKKGEGPLGHAWLSGRPLVAGPESEDGNAMIVLPVIKGCTLNSIVTLVL